jgi:hypothetical protein
MIENFEFWEWVRSSSKNYPQLKMLAWEDPGKARLGVKVHIQSIFEIINASFLKNN